ncbi:hypothetical protein APHAL10511_006491 [Amanita phalloides]|nr:hypothetical protein APHAL10511_006491 [Amanita phalloides]
MPHNKPCAKYQYVVTPSGPKILPVDDLSAKDEESPADYNAGGYLPIKVNDVFKNSRYRIVRKLGWGHFSTVWLVKDAQTHRHSALKVVKSACRYAETARDEIKLLSRVQSFSPNHPGTSHIVSFLDSFTHQGPESTHICIVFEPLGENLLALIERHKKKGVPRPLVRLIAKQILLGLEYLHDECDLVHTDIKPENILISIPDIENHIQNELLRSPSPTSRRVGVPLPTKTRAGMTIPHIQQRARRQVQIFDSQPLSSPSSGRTASVPCLHAFRGGATGSSSYGSPTHLASNSVTSMVSHIPRVSSNLSTSVPIHNPINLREPEAKANGNGKPGQRTLLPTQFKLQADSPPSSSSSSSIASIAVSTNVGSNISTPPTSLSQSLALSGLSITRASVELQRYPKDTKGKARTAFELDLGNTVVTTEVHKTKSLVPPRFSSNDAFAEANKRQDHSRSHSGASISGFWKDPGAAAPAPALVVSAVVGAVGADGDCLQLSNTTVQAIEDGPTPSSDVMPESSSTTAAVNSSPHRGPDAKQKTTSLINGVHKIITSNLTKSRLPNHISSPSLLTQTAPSRHPQISSARRISSKISSDHQPISSPHLLKQRSVSCKCTDPEHKHRSVTDERRTDNKSWNQYDSKEPKQKQPPQTRLVTSIITSPTLPCPNTPPPTPCDDRMLADRTLDTNFSCTATHEEDRSDKRTALPTLTLHALPAISIKIADLGNATPSTKHYTEDIQTRQYRAPEAILGRSDWDARADIWSVACLVFELLTAEYLFDPQGQGELFTKDDDHMAQIIELMGDFPMEVKMGGKYSRELFDHTGVLRYIRTLKYWPLKRVMVEKYLYTEAESAALCDLLEPMLSIDMRQRARARDMKNHHWLELNETDEPVTD